MTPAGKSAAPGGEPTARGGADTPRSPLGRARRLLVSSPAAGASEAHRPNSNTPGAGQTGAGRTRAGRNLPAAIGVGIGLGALVLLSLFLYRPSFAIFVGILMVYACWELARALQAGGIRISLVSVIATATIAPLANVDTLGRPIISPNVYGTAGQLAACIVVAIVTFAADFAFAALQRAVTPEGLKLAERGRPGGRRLAFLSSKRSMQTS